MHYVFSLPFLQHYSMQKPLAISIILKLEWLTGFFRDGCQHQSFGLVLPSSCFLSQDGIAGKNFLLVH